MEAAGAVDAKKRAHRSLENAQNAFSTAPTGLKNKSGQITCQTGADRSLVNNICCIPPSKDRIERATQLNLIDSYYV